jgi:hypothetical protein
VDGGRLQALLAKQSRQVSHVLNHY